MNVPIVTSVEELVVKKVQHFTFDYNGEEKFSPGVVVCQKPNSNIEPVIRFDCEDNSIVKIFPVTHADFISKRIRQMFANDEKMTFGESKEL